MSHPYEDVRVFHETYNLPVENTLIDLKADHSKLRALRVELLREEFQEYLDGEQADDMTEIADALGDIIYIACGTAVAYGIPLDKVFSEIHRSNMSKLGEDGKPIYREDGKVLKGPNYTPPNIDAILAHYR